VLHQVKNGSLIVLHDGYHGGENIARIIERLIPQLKQQGYQFISIDRM
jgi:peptidoglycan/xylan/chitin deacetylase (PgdA/CDA1 family)